MTFEQLDNQQREDEKKRKKLESEQSEQFWLEKQILRETSDLLHNLALKISQDFWIDILEAKELIRWNTSWDLEWLKWHLGKGKKVDILDFKNAIAEARSAIEDLSKKKRESLKQMLEEERYAPEKFEYSINKKLFSEDTLYKAQNPQNMWDHIIWVGLGIIDSTEAVILFSYALGKGILLTPYHLYLILTGKAQYQGLEKI